MKVKTSDANFLTKELEDDCIESSAEDIKLEELEVSQTTKTLKIGDTVYIPIQYVKMYEYGENLELCPICLHVSSRCILAGHHIQCCAKIKSENLRSEIYHDEENKISVYCVSGQDEISRRICQVGMCFFKNKTVYLDTSPFIFYLVFLDNHFGGFFSRERDAQSKNNLSCVVVLPEHRGKGLGTFLVDMSYKIGPGTPERPFSKDGLALYYRYWRYRIVRYLQQKRSTTLSHICKETNISRDDVVYTLDRLKILNIGRKELLGDVGFHTPDLLCKYEWFRK